MLAQRSASSYTRWSTPVVLPNILKNPLLEDFAGKWRSFVCWQPDPFSIFFRLFPTTVSFIWLFWHCLSRISHHFTKFHQWHPMRIPWPSPVSNSSMLFARSCCFFFSLASWSFSLASAARSTITSVKRSKAVCHMLSRCHWEMPQRVSICFNAWTLGDLRQFEVV